MLIDNSLHCDSQIHRARDQSGKVLISRTYKFKDKTKSN